jgi:hypothetical protein
LEHDLFGKPEAHPRIKSEGRLFPDHALAGGKAMADMRVVIAGAGGRMGRTLISAIAATKGMMLMRRIRP